MKLIKLIMPSQGDMEIVKQEGGVITLKPTYFGGECAGPIVQFVDEGVPTGKTDENGKFVGKDVIEASFRIKIKKDGELKLMRAE
jgi:hypothetical protein